VYRHLVRTAALAIMLVVAATPVAAGDGLTATLDGRRIGLGRVAEFNCHDFDYPAIRCFSTPDALAADMARHLGDPALLAGRLASGGFVTAWQDALYGGPSISLSVDYPSLSALGWNDRISSFKSFGATGNFREDSPAGGFSYVFGSTAQVSSLNGTYNDKFSAFYID